MPDEAPERRGDAEWKHQREEISRRNAEAHKRAQEQRRTRISVAERTSRDHAERESQQLRDLNVRISKLQGR
ncbi:MAG: hypothetical protein ACRDJY_05075 [Thermoleophilaceae bacterium]